MLNVVEVNITSYNQSQRRHIPEATTVRPAVTSRSTLVEAGDIVSQRVIVARSSSSSVVRVEVDEEMSVGFSIAENRSTISPPANDETDA